MPGYPAKFQPGDVATADGFGGWNRNGPAALRTTLGLGTTSAVTFAKVTTGSSPAALVTAAGINAIYLGTTDTNRTIFALGSAAPAGAASIRGYLFGAATDGAWGSLLATPSGAEIGFLLHGHDGTAITGAKGNAAIAAGSLWTAVNNETIFKISLTASGSTTLTEVARFQNSALGLGITPAVSGGLLQLASGTTAANGIAFGTDATLYRSAANRLRGSLTGFVGSDVGFTNGAAAALGTLTNSPVAGNPTKWIPFDDNGVTRYTPAW